MKPKPITMSEIILNGKYGKQKKERMIILLFKNKKKKKRILL